jgi:hypothetical protein
VGFEKRYNSDQPLPEGRFRAPGLEGFAEEVDARLREYAPQFDRGTRGLGATRQPSKRLVVADRRRKAEWRYVTLGLDRLWRKFTGTNASKKAG